MDVLDESEGFSQPLATPVIVTLIHHGVDFPAPVKHLAEGLRSLDSAVGLVIHCKNINLYSSFSSILSPL